MSTTGRIEFESVACTTCEGTGRFASYPQPPSAWTGTCLGCERTGRKLTRAGRAARKVWDDWTAARPDDVDGRLERVLRLKGATLVEASR